MRKYCFTQGVAEPMLALRTLNEPETANNGLESPIAGWGAMEGGETPGPEWNLTYSLCTSPLSSSHQSAVSAGKDVFYASLLDSQHPEQCPVRTQETCVE